MVSGQRFFQKLVLESKLEVVVGETMKLLTWTTWTNNDSKELFSKKYSHYLFLNTFQKDKKQSTKGISNMRPHVTTTPHISSVGPHVPNVGPHIWNKKPRILNIILGPMCRKVGYETWNGRFFSATLEISCTLSWKIIHMGIGWGPPSFRIGRGP